MNEIDILKENAMCYRLTDGSLIVAEEMAEDSENDCVLTGLQVNIDMHPEGLMMTPYAIPTEQSPFVNLYYACIISRFRPQEYVVEHFAAFIFQEVAENVIEEYGAEVAYDDEDPEDPDDFGTDFDYRYN